MKSDPTSEPECTIPGWQRAGSGVVDSMSKDTEFLRNLFVETSEKR